MIRAAFRRVLDGSARNSALESERHRTLAAHDRIRELWDTVYRLREEVRGLTARAVSAEADLEVRLDEVSHLDGRVAELEEEIRRLTDRDAVTWANHGFVPASRLAELEARGGLFPVSVTDGQGRELYRLDVDSYAGGSQSELDLADGFPGLLALRRTDRDGSSMVAEYLREEVAIHRGMRWRIQELRADLDAARALRLNWQADLEAVRECFDRLGVPHGPGPTAAPDREADDSEPAPTLVWRLAWLEGLVGALRSIPVPPATPRGASHE